MTYKINFQYKPEGCLKPYDTSQDQELIFKSGEFISIPNTGDIVDYSFDNQRKVFKVSSRYFSYRLDSNGGDLCLINVIVTDISPEETAVWEEA